ncbi:hypothetical protein Tco_0789065 [Tanacetum coccineum]
MFDRYRTEEKMAKKSKKDDLRMNRHEYDISALDTAIRENRFDNSKIKKFVLGLNDPYIMARDVALAAREHVDKDTTTPEDPQPSEPRGSPRDP